MKSGRRTARQRERATVLVPCDVAPHPGLRLGSETLRMVLARVDDACAARAVCRAFRDRCPRRHPAPWRIALSSVERFVAELACGLDPQGVTTEAVRRNDFELLRCARSHGCPYDDRTFWLAIKRGSLKMVKWMHRDGAPYDRAYCLRESWGIPHVEHWIKLNTRGTTLVGETRR